MIEQLLIKAPDMTDWSEVVRRHGPIVWKTAYRLLNHEADAADCFQNTFVSAWELSRAEAVRNEPLGTTKSPGWEKSVTKVFFKEPGLLREERADGDVMIQNITAGLTLRYDPSTKKATQFPLKPQPPWLAFRKFFLDGDPKWADGAEQRLAEREVDGTKAQGVELRENQASVWNIWVDAKTGNLLCLEHVSPDWKTVMSKIVLNPDLPDTLFSVEPPKGYELTVWKDKTSGSGEMTAEQRRVLELEKKAASEAAEAAKRQAVQRRADPANKDKKAGSHK
jgi:outer membrane lipoprotein-sorting protein